LKPSTDNKTSLVFDLGGGAFDVSVIRVMGQTYTVFAVNGDTHLGGHDFDERTTNHVKSIYLKQTGIDLSGNLRALERLRREAIRAKMSLSAHEDVQVIMEGLDDNGSDIQLSRSTPEDLCSDPFEKLIGPLQKVLDDAGLLGHQIDEVVKVSGSSRIPMV
jgi:heat shock protein 5